MSAHRTEAQLMSQSAKKAANVYGVKKRRRDCNADQAKTAALDY